MAQREPLATRIEEDWNTLYWWRRRAPSRLRVGEPTAAAVERIEAFAERRRNVVDAALTVARRRETARTAPATRASPVAAAAVDPVLVIALRHERRSALLTFIISLLATAAPAATLVYATIVGHEAAAAFASAGMLAALYGLCFALRRVLVLGLARLPRFL